MNTLFKYIIALAIAIGTVACTERNTEMQNTTDPPSTPDVPGDNDPGDNVPGENEPGDKPTTPIKRRPIVPTSKLPRPRIIDRIEFNSGILSIHLNAEETMPTIEVLCPATTEVITLNSYVETISLDVAEEVYILNIYLGDEIYTETITLTEQK